MSKEKQALTAKDIAQWVIDNRWPKSENDKVSDFEMFHKITNRVNIHTAPLLERIRELEKDIKRISDHDVEVYNHWNVLRSENERLREALELIADGIWNEDTNLSNIYSLVKKALEQK